MHQTEDDVLGVLLLPAIVDDTSVLAYAKAHGLVRDWPQFLARVARCLLLDPLKVRSCHWALRSRFCNAKRVHHSTKAEISTCTLIIIQGKLLKAISKWCKAAGLSHFPAVLARAVEGHGELEG